VIAIPAYTGSVLVSYARSLRGNCADGAPNASHTDPCNTVGLNDQDEQRRRWKASRHLNEGYSLCRSLQNSAAVDTQKERPVIPIS
jgi:hypothetical protein